MEVFPYSDKSPKPDEELVDDLLVLLDVVALYAREYAAAIDGLTAVQKRCTELLEENRYLKAKLERLKE